MNNCNDYNNYNEYEPNHSIWNEEDIRTHRIKVIMQEYLSHNEYEIFRTFLDCNLRYKDFLQKVNSDQSISRLYLTKIRKKILTIYNELYPNTDNADSDTDI